MRRSRARSPPPSRRARSSSTRASRSAPSTSMPRPARPGTRTSRSPAGRSGSACRAPRGARSPPPAPPAGAMGFALPPAAGAAIAAPDRPVIALQADGSGMYIPQALWTCAREGLDVTALVCANSSYQILLEELRRAGVEAPDPGARRLTSLGEPALDWVALAGGMGVPARRATTAGEVAAGIEWALAEPGPHLVEMVF